MLTDDHPSTCARVEAWAGFDRPAPLPAFAPGVPVVARGSARRGVVTSVISPARAGRSVYVMWEGERELSLLRPDDIVPAAAPPARRTEWVRLVAWTLPRA